MFKVKLLITLGLLSISGCVATVKIEHPKPCSSLVTEEQRQPTPGAKIPPVDGNENWFTFGVAQTEQLGKANKQGENNLSIIQHCEERDAATTVTVKQELVLFRKKK